jgi:hypothetical protein
MSTPVVVLSAIEAVSVYRRGATVVRRAVLGAAELAGGVPAELELVGLPLSLVDGSAQVQIVAVEPSSVDVVATAVRVGIHVQPGLPAPPAPAQQELDDVAAEIESTTELMALIEHELSLLTSLPVPERPTAEEGRPPPPAPLAMRLALEAFADGAGDARRRQRRTLQTRLRELERQQAALLERVRASSTAAEVKRSELSKSLVIPLRVTGAPTQIVVEVRYHVPGARWVPAYQVKLARDGSSATIQQRAHVVQASGEDWQGVRLKLSTAEPTRPTSLPKLASIRIGRAQPTPPARGFRPAPQGGAQLFVDLDRSRERLMAALPAPRPWSMPTVTAMPTASAMPLGASFGARAEPELRTKQSKRKERMRDEEAYKSSDSDDMDLEGSFDAAPPPPAMMESRRSMAASMMASAGGPPPSPAPRSAPKRAAVDDEDVAFGLLMLPPAQDTGRGRLVRALTGARYAESAARAGRPLPFDVSVVVAEALDAAEGAGHLPVPAQCVAVGESSSFDHAYEADGVVDVAADGGWHSVPLGDREATASMRYVAVPREELAVYRVAALSNPLRAPMLTGPAEVYVGGEYVLTTTLPDVPARGEFTLGLGVEQAIKIARNARYNEVRDGKGVVSMVELVHDIDVDIVNHLQRRIDIEVRERVPVPAPDAEVQVEERDVTPKWEVWDQMERGEIIDGGRRWQIVVDAGAQQQLKARYVLRLFSNAELQGGNRREA